MPPGGALSIPGRRYGAGEGRVPRYFAGLELPEALKWAAAELQIGLRDARWLDPDGLHLTLAFIGEVEQSARPRIAAALSRVEASAFAVALHGVGHFPQRGPPRVLWTGASPEPELGRLAASVRRALDQGGYPPERRKFAPHVTIARFRRPPSPSSLQGYLAACSLFRSPAVPVTSFGLFSSVLHPSGARYTLEADFPLLGTSPPGP